MATTCGISLVGVAPLVRPPHWDFFVKWLASGIAGGMPYLNNHQDKRQNPAQILPGAQSMIVCAESYLQPSPDSGRFPALSLVSKYALGRDYHEVLRDKLTRFARLLHAQDEPSPRYPSYKVFVDTGPVLEREYAALSGVGWIGKNTCLIHPKFGSYLFLGVVLTTKKISSDVVQPDRCGKCHKCIEACPTGALEKPYVLNPNKCISYLTIEHRGEFSSEQAEQARQHLFGCDICQTVCPWNNKALVSSETAYRVNPAWEGISLEDVAKMDEKLYQRLVSNTSLKRAKRQGLRRNARNCLVARRPLKK